MATVALVCCGRFVEKSPALSYEHVQNILCDLCPFAPLR